MAAWKQLPRAARFFYKGHTRARASCSMMRRPAPSTAAVNRWDARALQHSAPGWNSLSSTPADLSPRIYRVHLFATLGKAIEPMLVIAGHPGNPAAPGQGCPKSQFLCCSRILYRVPDLGCILIWAVSAGHSGHPAAPGAGPDHAVCGAPPVNGCQMRPGAEPFLQCQVSLILLARMREAWSFLQCITVMLQ